MADVKKAVAVEMELVIKDCKTVFAEGFIPGGFAKQIVTFKVRERDVDSPVFRMSVLDAGAAFMKENVDVVYRFTDDTKQGAAAVNNQLPVFSVKTGAAIMQPKYSVGQVVSGHRVIGICFEAELGQVAYWLDGRESTVLEHFLEKE
ncbi:uncharacterized protein NMK_2442 [Novimethylophilus kurashikiensis]|uniref:Uncharacterized protein n=1 Tax=Novimethylophilus kurashikiensis TaxID=1825523 RepID=A0A2R5FE58_9PROT|nr:hypothetical protein [Novimethylophilus kurashikiensis]GBG14841.1 uncharacterized protein NMK_2442 [Novimethylophilus kurashikiensis]